MKAFISILIIIGSHSVFAKTSAPQIVFEKGDHKLELGKQAIAALKKYNPDFHAWTNDDFMPSVRKYYKPSTNQTLFGVVGDFSRLNADFK